MMTSETNDAGEPFKVFLSYDTVDCASGQRVADHLRTYLNARVFSPDTLSPGESWRKRLRDEISGSKLFVMVLSPHSLDSAWMRQELGAAWALEKPVLSVCTEPDLLQRLPVELSKVNCIQLRDLDDPAKFNRAVLVLLGDETEKKEEEASSLITSEKPT